MQTTLGANGQIAVGLARQLQRIGSDGLELVSRTPRKATRARVCPDQGFVPGSLTLEFG